MERVVITGMGVASALGCSLKEYWQGLIKGHSGVVRLDEVFPRLAGKIGAPACEYDESRYFSKKEARRISRSSQLAIVAAEEALEQAGMNGARFNGSGQGVNGYDPAEVGVLIGSSIGGFAASDPSFEDYYTRGRMSPFTIPVSMNIGPSANLSIRHRFQGPILASDAACASAAHAIAHAFLLVRSGMLRIVLAGGSDSPFSPVVVTAWEATRALSIRIEDPATACRPFSADRDGLVLGEGAGVLVLEAETSALQRGAPILAEILGFGVSSDSHHLTQPTVDGPALALRRALKNADLTPGEIDYINAHGTGTAWNDANESAAIKAALGEHAYRIPVVSTKAGLGHTIGASGALELISCVLSLRDQLLPPTINYNLPDPLCDLDYVTAGSRPHSMRFILSSSFAFGGSNAVLVLGRYE